MSETATTATSTPRPGAPGPGLDMARWRGGDEVRGVFNARAGERDLTIT